MSNALNVARYTNVDQQKSDGATYTPKPLAEFVANQIISVFEIPKKGEIRILDPACGDGALLDALVNNLPSSTIKRLVVRGFDTDLDAIKIATSKLLSKYPGLNLQLEQKDFLHYVLNLQGNGDLFSNNEAIEPFNLVIANPPYVRTQIMGSEQAQKLAQSFNLSGRVDLYYPFILGISKILDKNGITGVITSNRFMTTKSGQDIRREMLTRFKMLSIWDLGDTKLFDAAVLPSVFIASGNCCKTLNTGGIAFSSIYETKDSPTTKSSDALKALAEENDTVTEVPDGRFFRIRRGTLANGNIPEGVWRIATKQTDKWLATVEKNTWDTFSRIGKIRVGVKSTADKVFLRSDWDDLPTGKPELLKPLITRKCAQRFRALVPENPKHRKEILYPHEATESGRSAVDLSLYPNSARYLEQHRQKLESRKYLIEAGRNWYELWVPQDPAAWAQPKLVFPDISEKPIFWMDTSGGIVNGECYWLQCKNKNEQNLMWLALAVANSSFIEAFYDHRFNNKLYAGKRRFITQYVEQFPLPKPDSPEAIEIIRLTKEIHKITPSAEAEKLGTELEELIWKAFGLNSKEISR
ncbi:HsdM family class I SAM-dependent methyltransferase [Nitrincola alkalilacustris]|uniref:HsdM family class I SAM-dependent methyltransferase n=1 Tax=Nitrincola alkalilacustris TaxID=1571224 RepID=UPI00124DE4DA|nr:N-6 DNA methylase [Nitrincola alkalilacustris]